MDAAQSYESCRERGLVLTDEMFGHPSLSIRVVRYLMGGVKRNFMLMEGANTLFSVYILYLMACQTLWECVNCSEKGDVDESLWASLSNNSFDLGVEACKVRENMINIINAGYLILGKLKIPYFSGDDALIIARHRSYLTSLCKQKDIQTKIKFFRHVARCQQRGGFCLKECFDSFRKKPVPPVV